MDTRSNAARIPLPSKFGIPGGQAAKRALYTKHNLRLTELPDADIERLDDVLPRMLLKFGIESA